MPYMTRLKSERDSFYKASFSAIYCGKGGDFMKFLVIRKRHLVLAAGLMLALAIFCAVNVPSAVTAAAWGDVILR